jgi:hypothetical protein
MISAVIAAAALVINFVPRQQRIGQRQRGWAGLVSVSELACNNPDKLSIQTLLTEQRAIEVQGPHAAGKCAKRSYKGSASLRQPVSYRRRASVKQRPNSCN